MPFPAIRMRRRRATPWVRALLRETELSPRHLIAPLFIRPGRRVRQPISSMPGQEQLSIDQAVRQARDLRARGLGAVILFGIPERKDAAGSGAWSASGIVQKAVRALKRECPELLILTDLCFCEYTTHGHCGVLRAQTLDNDATLRNIARVAVAQARAGADIIAPSGMIDGMVRTIRRALDRAGFQDRMILSYAAKFCSAYYGPFRDAAESAPRFGDRKSYQMDPANAAEALREVALDLEEGADLVMVKPALAYLDIIRRVKDRFPGVPVVAYNVSGEYSLIKAAAEKGWADEHRLVDETLLGIRRAGADLIISYHARDWAASR